MATGLESKIDSISLSDGVEANITICCWNIMGDAKATDREKVTTETFNHQFTNESEGTKTSLGQADIICLQEMAVKPDGDKAKNYLPSIDSYTAVYNRESAGKINAVFFKKEKFKWTKKSGQIEQAFQLMEIKRNIYDKIERKGDNEKKQAEQGKLQPWGENDDEKKMCEEVLDECKSEAKFSKGRSRYMRPGELETKSPKTLLNDRMAIECLQLKSNPNYSVVVISVHNYSKRSGKELPANFAYLLFDFLAKLEVPILIAGDFNLDITKEKSLAKYICEYSIEKYEMRPLRKDKKRKDEDLARIDFILLGNVDGASFESSLQETTAHDLQVPSTTSDIQPEKITNHNPLSATLIVKKKK